MKSVNWQNGQRIIKQVLDWFSSSKDQNDQEYRQDMTQAGIVADSLNEMDIIVGANNTPATPSITVRTGVAYDSNGERIYISDENISYDATNPSDTTDDGRGVLLPTPHSTGSKNIPLTANSFNYVWVDYLQIIDESLFTLQTATNAKQFYKKDNGYKITTTTVNTPPTAASVYLGSINLTGFGVVSGSTISTANRTYSLLKENRVKIKTPLANLSDATTTYGFNQEHTLDEHIKAVGSGVVTPQNPHGITLGDIGVDVEAVVANHQKFMHYNGMIGSKTSTSSSLYTEFHAISPGDDYIIIKPLGATEVVNVDGITITSSDIPSDTTFLFSSIGDVSGTYYIYLDKFTKSLVRTTIDPSSDITKYPVVSMVWTAGVPALYDGNLTSITDLRVFGTINNDKIDTTDEYDMASLSVEDGSVSAPSLRWQSDLDTGIYRSGSGVISFTSNGVLSANISGGQISAVNGTAASPAYAFLLDPNTGLYSESADILSIATGGSKRVSIDSTSVSITSVVNQIVLGSSNTTTLSATAPSASRIYTFPDAGANANVALTEGGQVFNGNPNSFQYLRSVPQIGVDGYAHYVMQVDSDPSHTWEIVASGASGNPLTFKNWGFANPTTLNAQQQLTIGDTLTLYTGIGSVAIFKNPAISGARTFTLPDVPSSNFLMSEGAQTANGAMTFSNDLTIGTRLVLTGQSSGQSISNNESYAGTLTWLLQNTGGEARMLISGGAGDDPYTTYTVGTTDWASGIDNSDSDKYKISYAISSSPHLGTNDVLTLTTSNQVQIPSGTSALPSLAFNNDNTTGIYRIGSNNLGISLGGVSKVDINSTNASFASPVRATHVSGAQVAYQFVGQSAGTGLSSFTGEVSLYYLGNEKLRVGNSTIAFTGMTAGGSVSGLGTYSFLNPHNTTKIENSTFNSADHLGIFVDGNRWMYFDAENGQTSLEQHGLFIDFNSTSGSAAEFSLEVGNDATMSDGVSYKQLSLRTGNGASAHTSGQTTTGVSTSATTIKSSVSSGLTMVTGDSAGTRFMDVLLVGAGGNALINVISQISVTGAPAGRSYSLLGSSLRLAMGSGTYDINVIQYGLSFR